MGDNILNLDAVPFFVESEWIGIGKQYPTTNTPYEVEWAREKLLKIPDAEVAHLPSPNLPVTQFLQVNLPPQSSEIITVKAQAWFSHEKPTTDIAILMSRPVPPQNFLLNLEGTIGQAWFDGTKSIIDTRFNNGMDRLPFWVITFWKTMAKMVEKQTIWKRCCKWLDSEEAKTKDTTTIKAICAARQLTTSIGWNQTLPYSRQTVTTLDLTSLLSTAWLSDEHIDMMMQELSDQVASDPELARRVIIAPLAFSAKLKHMALIKHDPYSKKNAPLLCRYEKHVKENGIEALYFPVHVGGNHWIAGHLNFKEGFISFGQ
jgi:hypothetical protein